MSDRFNMLLVGVLREMINVRQGTLQVALLLMEHVLLHVEMSFLIIQYHVTMEHSFIAVHVMLDMKWKIKNVSQSLVKQRLSMNTI